MSTPQNYCCQCLFPCSEPKPPPLFAEGPPIPAGRYSMTRLPGVRSLLFSLGPGTHSLLWENLCNIIIFQFVGHLPGEWTSLVAQT